MCLLSFSGPSYYVAKVPSLVRGVVEYVEGYPGLVIWSFSVSLAVPMCCRMEVNSLVLEVKAGLPAPVAASLCQFLVPGQAEPWEWGWGWGWGTGPGVVDSFRLHWGLILK